MIRMIGRKQLLVLGALGLGAVGATHVPGHAPFLMDVSGSSRTAVASTVSSEAVYGPNNLLGEVAADTQQSSGIQLSEDHLVSGMALTQAGDTASLLERLRGVTSNVKVTQAAVAPISAAAIPEPATAGLVMTLLVPTLIRRRRSSVSGI